MQTLNHVAPFGNLLPRRLYRRLLTRFSTGFAPLSPPTFCVFSVFRGLVSPSFTFTQPVDLTVFTVIPAKRYFPSARTPRSITLKTAKESPSQVPAIPGNCERFLIHASKLAALSTTTSPVCSSAFTRSGILANGLTERRTTSGRV